MRSQKGTHSEEPSGEKSYNIQEFNIQLSLGVAYHINKDLKNRHKLLHVSFLSPYNRQLPRTILTILPRPCMGTLSFASYRFTIL